MIREELFKLLASNDPEVRFRAVQELSTLQDADAIACLIDCLGDAAHTVRNAARSALRTLTGLDFSYHRDQWRDWWKERASLRCNGCGRPLFAARLYYLARLQLTSEPKDIYLSGEDLKPLSARGLQQAAEELAGRDALEVRDEVYVRLKYYLCTPCKLTFVRDARASGASDEE